MKLLHACHGPVTRIQSLIRCYLAQNKVLELRRLARIQQERILEAQIRYHSCQQRIETILLLKSIHNPIQYKKGTLQVMFQYWSHTNNKSNSNTVHRLDGRSFVKMLKETPGIMKHSSSSPSYKQKRWNGLSVTDIDIIFAKTKTKHTNYLTFSQFIEAMYLINDKVFPQDDIEYRGYTGKDGKFLQIMMNHMFLSKTGTQFRKLHQETTITFMNSKAILLQSWVRRFLSLFIYNQRFQERNEERKRQFINKQCILLQQQARIFLSKQRARSLAKMRYQKFMDPDTNAPYWYNTRTNTVSWDKPKIFGLHYDCENTPTFTFPKHNEEFVIVCSYCEVNLADRNCNTCHETFCQACFDSFHRKGNRSTHTHSSISFCSVCRFQHGTRICMTCTSYLERPHILCDTCFSYTHHNKHNKYTDTRQNKIKQQLQQHVTSWIVSPCVECQSLAARWRCIDCQDEFCLQCCDRLHRHGKRLVHSFEKMNYHTLSMSHSYKKWMRQKTIRDQLHQKDQSRKLKQQRTIALSVILIQKIWRGYTGRHVGKLYLKKERQKLRQEWRQRQGEIKQRTLKFKLRRQMKCAILVFQQIKKFGVSVLEYHNKVRK